MPYVFKYLVQHGVLKVFPVFLVLMDTLWIQYKLLNEAGAIGLACQALHGVHTHLEVGLHFANVFFTVFRRIYLL
jgi:hypothetical protein